MKGRKHDNGDRFGGGLRATIMRKSVCAHTAGEYSNFGVVYLNVV